jgi:Uma2 family endonuclease
MQIELPDLDARTRIVLDHQLSDDEYFHFCQANPDLRIERNAEGEIIIAPPVGGESDYRSADVGSQLKDWAKRDGRGRAFGSSTAFLLPDGSALSPDAAWVSNEKIGRLTKEQRRKFLPLTPEFVAEVLSPNDRLPAAKAKMDEWIANGVQLGWLIEGDARTVHVYRPDREPVKPTGIPALAADAPLQGFVLELEDIWEGL